jgi:IS5 family transposase
VPAEVIASVLVLQALEGLSDREALSALRRDIAWKVACGLRLDDEGFHPTVLVYWRNRLRTSSRPRRVFDAVRQVVEQTGVLRGRGRRVLDSTILEDAGRHPGHRHAVGRGDPPGAAAGAPRPRGGVDRA